MKSQDEGSIVNQGSKFGHTNQQKSKYMSPAWNAHGILSQELD